jgi:hypothetical protein
MEKSAQTSSINSTVYQKTLGERNQEKSEAADQWNATNTYILLKSRASRWGSEKNKDILHCNKVQGLVTAVAIR